MTYDLLLTEDAVNDLQDIYDYVVNNDSERKADQLIDAIQGVLENLSLFPERGTYVTELKDLGMTEYRQVFYKPYRMIYRTMDNRVIIYLITDGRRNMQTYLSRRFLLK